MSERSYAIIGTGAIGGYYGACLQKAGYPVHFLLNRDYEWVKEHGLSVESVNGDFTLPDVKAYSNATEMPPCDVVLVALKTTQNHLLANILPAVLKEDGVVVMLQNGLGAEEEASAIVGANLVMGGLCFICSNKVGPGKICHLDYGEIAIAQYSLSYSPAGITHRMRSLATDFESAGIPIHLSEDLLQTRWEKLVWNIPYNGLSVVLNATTEEMMADFGVRVLIEQIMEEVALGARICDRVIDDDFIQSRLENTAKMKPYRTSMKLDYDYKRPLELNAIFGKPLQMASDRNVHLSRIQMLYQQLQFLDTKNRQ